jgi:RNA polymerase sigma factor for flagellar operon FliA
MTTQMSPTLRSLSRDEYERYLPMVRRIAMRMARRVPRHITVNDLIACGWVGLVEAFSRAREDMPTEEFEAYASYRVRGAMLDYLRELDPVSRELRALSRKISTACREVTKALGRSPDESEIAQHLGWTVDEYREALHRVAMGGMARLELIDFEQLPTTTLNPEEETSHTMLKEAVAEAIPQLPPRLQQVLGLYYQNDCTLREIGDVLGVTEARACQLHSEAIHRLRAMVGRA